MIWIVTEHGGHWSDIEGVYDNEAEAWKHAEALLVKWTANFEKAEPWRSEWLKLLHQGNLKQRLNALSSHFDIAIYVEDQTIRGKFEGLEE